MSGLEFSPHRPAVCAGFFIVLHVITIHIKMVTLSLRATQRQLEKKSEIGKNGLPFCHPSCIFVFQGLRNLAQLIFARNAQCAHRLDRFVALHIQALSVH